MARKIKVRKEKEKGMAPAFVVMDGNQEVAWDYTEAGAMRAALETALNERDNLRHSLEEIQKLKKSLREFLS